MSRVVQDIKKAQRESLLFREISKLFLEKKVEDPELSNLFINRVELSKDGGVCYVLFYSENGPEEFEAALHHLKLYKPSLRKALAQTIHGRYVPQVRFIYDTQLSKQLAVESLIENVSKDTKKHDDSNSNS